MKLHLRVLVLSANLPLEDSSISFLISDKNPSNPISDDSYCNLNPQQVLMSNITEMNFVDTHFIIEVENPQEPKKFDLSVLATSLSTSNAVLLGSVHIDARKLSLHQTLNGTKKTIKESLLLVNNQKGSLTFEIHIIQPLIYSSHRNLKSTESLDREQTCSSDSYEANLKDLNKTNSSDQNEDFSPKFKQSLENHYRNVDYTQKVIMEEIDLEDDEDEDFEEMKSSKNSKNYLRKSNAIKKPVDCLRSRLLKERLQIQIDLHNLHENDFFLIRMQQKLRVFDQ